MEKWKEREDEERMKGKKGEEMKEEMEKRGDKG